MEKTVKTSDGKCWSEGVEVSCPKDKTQTRKMTSKPVKEEDKIAKQIEYAKERKRKFGWWK